MRFINHFLLNCNRKSNISLWCKVTIASFLTGLSVNSVSLAENNNTRDFIPLEIQVNSAEDGDIKADNKLTLREAIALANNQLSTEKLSASERTEVQVLKPGSSPKITFDLPAESRTIYLQKVLPDIEAPGLLVDGTSQPEYRGYPLIAIAADKLAEIPRGLTLVADGITVKGLSIYGFDTENTFTAQSPNGNIVISHRLPPPDTAEQTLPADYLPFYLSDVPPKNIVVTDNWLGINLDGNVPAKPSGFGVYVFNSLGTKIERNIISAHRGSGIITSVRAEKLNINNNKIENNAFSGMSDAIRLEGFVYGTKIAENVIANNGGSGIYLFKAEGSVDISRNYLKNNGKRVKKAAIYLSGNNHKVSQNTIVNQPAAGIAIASYPRSKGNMIRSNRFFNLGGLSIDLNTQDNVGVADWQRGDGANPDRNSRNRRLDTANGAVNAPKFLAKEFYILDGKVNLDGLADPNTAIEVYLTQGDRLDYNPLFKLLKVVKANKEGKFSLTLDNLKPGDRLSAVAIDPEYGTSEPTLDVVVRSLSFTP